MMDVYYNSLLANLKNSCESFYGERLIAVVVYGSVGRGTARPDSDLDILVVAHPLPMGRIPRIREFDVVEKNLESALFEGRKKGFNTVLSTVIKSPDEVKRGSLLFLDMTEDAIILFDRDGFFKSEMDAFRKRLDKLGARRIWRGEAWFWDLKPDYKTGEIFEI
jgi:uncharacterized protein